MRCLAALVKSLEAWTGRHSLDPAVTDKERFRWFLSPVLCLHCLACWKLLFLPTRVDTCIRSYWNQTKFHIYKVWWLREASQTLKLPCEKLVFTACWWILEDSGVRARMHTKYTLEPAYMVFTLVMATYSEMFCELVFIQPDKVNDKG